MKSLLKRFLGAEQPFVWNPHANISFSQCGEDLIVQYVFKLRGIELPSYIDIGAHHPYYLSNTALFHQKGCKGINIEANPNLIAEFVNARQSDINLNIGLADTNGEMEFFIMEDSTLSTFSIEERDSLVAQGKQLFKTVKVPLKTIDQVLKEYFDSQFPDFMSLDVEGVDFDILKSIDFRSASPKVICVEAAEYSSIGAGKRRDDLINYIVEQGFTEYANTNLNAIMVKNDFWFV